MFVLGLFLGLALCFASAIAFVNPFFGVPLFAAFVSIAIAAYRNKLHWAEYEINEYGARDLGDEWSGSYFPNGQPMAINGGIALSGPMRMSDEY
jgi:hypothetical protein